MTSLSTATHSEVLGHEMPSMTVVSTLAIVKAEAPPVGLVEVTTSPVASVATQRETLGHDMPRSSWVVPSTAATLQVEAPPVGLVEVTTLPSKSTATHSEVLGQEMAPGRSSPSASATFHVDAPPVGFVEVTTFPWLSVATHREVLGHEMAVSSYPGPAPDASDVASAVRVPVAISTANRMARSRLILGILENPRARLPSRTRTTRT